MASEHSKLLRNFALTGHLTEDKRLRLLLRPNFTPLRSAKLLLSSLNFYIAKK